MGGLAAKAGADTFDSLPAEIDVLPSPQTSEVYASDGTTLLAYLYDENRRDVAFAEMAEVVRQAMVASEDSRFYQHNGVDMKGVARAFVNNQRGGQTQGASTLTMQYVRQVVSYSAKTPSEVVAATEDTGPRKVAEIKRALAIEKKLSKDEILERDLNIASFGNGAFGISAASQVYFGKTAKDLSLGEASLLVGLVKAPSDFDPADPKKQPRAIERRDNYVLPQMVKMGYVTQQQADEAKATKLAFVNKRTPEGCTQIQRPDLNAGYFCDYLIRWWGEQAKFGGDSYERLNKLRSAGYKIISSLDIQAQASSVKSINDVMAKKGGNRTTDTMMLAGVQPGTGRVQSMAVNRTFSNDQTANGENSNPAKKGQKGNWPNTTVPLLSAGGDIQGYQAGSVFKMFTIVAALERGLPLDYPIDAKSPYKSKYIIDRGSPAACPGTNFYCPENSGKNDAGVVNMWSGLGRSINTFFVPLQEQIGTSKVIDVAKRLGLVFHNDEDSRLAQHADEWGAYTLGVTAQTPLEMANAYATLAADGKYCKPTPLLELRDLTGKKLEGAEPECKDVVSPDVARGAVDAGRCPLGGASQYGKCGGSGTAPDTASKVKHPVFGKSGTTDKEKSATLIVSTKSLTMAGFYTDADWPQTNERFEHNGGVNPAVQFAMAGAMAGKPIQQFEKPSQKIAFGTQVSIPSVKCNTVQQARDKLQRAGFQVTTGGSQASECPAGTVAGTNPDGRTVKGGVVSLITSTGGGAASPGPGGRGGGRGGAGGGTGGGTGDGDTGGRCNQIPWLCPRD